MLEKKLHILNIELLIYYQVHLLEMNYFYLILLDEPVQLDEPIKDK